MDATVPAELERGLTYRRVPTTGCDTMGFLDTLKKLALGPDDKPLPDLGRNDRCWCGSGKKYKACHLERDARRRASARADGLRAPAGGF
jgi:hypothetical protein